MNAPDVQASRRDAWLDYVSGKLTGDGFVPLPPQAYQPAGFTFAARRTTFELTKFGMSETFFVFAETEVLTPQALANFSAAAYRFAMHSKAVPLPCGCFESVWCFAVAMTGTLNPALAHWIKTTEPPKHWASAEIPVTIDMTTGQLAYFEGTPLWGAAYYAGFRRQIARCLQ